MAAEIALTLIDAVRNLLTWFTGPQALVSISALHMLSSVPVAVVFPFLGSM